MLVDAELKVVSCKSPLLKSRYDGVAFCGQTATHSAGDVTLNCHL